MKTIQIVADIYSGLNKHISLANLYCNFHSVVTLHSYGQGSIQIRAVDVARSPSKPKCSDPVLLHQQLKSPEDLRDLFSRS